MIPLAITRGDVADYVSALIIVYIGLIFCNILLSYVPRMPYRPWLRSVLDFITDIVREERGCFRRLLPPSLRVLLQVEGRELVRDLLLVLVQAIVPGLIEG